VSPITHRSITDASIAWGPSVPTIHAGCRLRKHGWRFADASPPWCRLDDVLDAVERYRADGRELDGVGLALEQPMLDDGEPYLVGIDLPDLDQARIAAYGKPGERSRQTWQAKRPDLSKNVLVGRRIGRAHGANRSTDGPIAVQIGLTAPAGRTMLA
jgi:hypothetical protein